MRKYKQIIIAIVISAALVILAWIGGSNNKATTVEVICAAADIEAGTIIGEQQLSAISVEKDDISGSFFLIGTDIIGSQAISDIKADEIITTDRISSEAAGIDYPGGNEDRRLMTVSLPPDAANGYWLAEGNIIDLYLVPRSATEKVLHKLPGLEIVKIISNSSSSGQLLCLDLSCDQADFLAENLSSCNVRAAVINE